MIRKQMALGKTKTDATIRNARAFWEWFSAHVDQISRLYSCRDFDSLSKALGIELDKVDPELAWEIGPGMHREHLLTISSEGDPRLRPIAKTMIALAPNVDGWEFYSSRPPRPAPAKVRLPERSIEFDTQGWKFIPIPVPGTHRLDLVILDDTLASAGCEAALRAVSIYLDEYLGEDTVEDAIGRFSVAPVASAGDRPTYKIGDLWNHLHLEA